MSARFLLDTNVVSETIKREPSERVVAWLMAQPSTAVYLSVMTLGEIAQGIVRAPDPRRVERLTAWLESDLMPRFQGRILPVDERVMATWGRITGEALLRGKTVGFADSLLAATAIAHDLTLVTRNTRDVEALPVATLNPWD